MAKMGPKKKYFVTDEMIKEVEKLSFQGALQCELWAYYGMSKDTWFRLCNSHPELREACRRQKAKADIFVRGKLMQLVSNGNPAAIFFYHKVHLGAVEVQRIIHEEVEPPKIKGLDPIESAKVYQQFMKEN